MPNYMVRIELTPEDVARIDQLVGLQADAGRERTNAQIISERIRTVDQIKRLFAVVMGFALTTCITNAYLCARPLSSRSGEELSIVIAFVIVFSSLIALFYLGAERLLDRKYLRPDSPVPTWLGLWIDLGTLGATAIAFVVLANVFQGPDPGVSYDLAALQKFQAQFMSYLVVLYLLDTVLLVTQGTILFVSHGWSVLLRAHIMWTCINIISLCIVLWLRRMTDFSLPYVGASAVAMSLILWHVIRFFVDFRGTFEFYYPNEDLVP